ncbi:MAG: polysaccharide deacetylase family protein [Acidobacteriaceae bacterium]|nr:polysaccharide deacetylase family protein [Acidobacteriaceae bacterium]
MRCNSPEAALARGLDDSRTAWKEVAKSALRCLPEKLIAWRSRAHSAVALTFDDGPDEYTPGILDVLKRFDARATFFLVGQRIAGNETVVRRILQEGHEIGNHSFSHPDFDGLSIRDAIDEVDRTQSVLEKTTGRRCKWFRPPKGKLCAASLASAWSKGLSIAMWSIDVKDFRAHHPQDIVAKLDATRIACGDIVLYHGNNEAAFAALPQVIEHAVAAKGPLVPVSALIGGARRA